MLKDTNWFNKTKHERKKNVNLLIFNWRFLTFCQDANDTKQYFDVTNNDLDSGDTKCYQVSFII